MIELLFRRSNDFYCCLTVDENNNWKLLCVSYFQRQFKFYKFFEVYCFFCEKFNICLLFFHHYWCFSFYWSENRHRESFYFIFYVTVIRKYCRIIVFHDSIISFDEYFDDWNYDDLRRLLSKKCWERDSIFEINYVFF